LFAQLGFFLAARRVYFGRIDIGDANRLVLEIERIAVDDAVVVRRPSASAKRNICQTVSRFAIQPIVQNNETVFVQSNFRRHAGECVCDADHRNKYDQ
jgi:hypothetical protein